MLHQACATWVMASGWRVAGPGRPLAIAHKLALQGATHTDTHAHTGGRTQTQAEACEWAMACAHGLEFSERRPTGDVAGELGARVQASAYTQISCIVA
eukprot:COSAG01_NODE_957_length_12474_cov_44.298182_7_plen_98_part_00